MRIKRLTLRLPARLRHSAHLDARRIAQAIAEQINTESDVSQLTIEVSGDGQQSSELAYQAGQQAAQKTGGNH